MDVWKRDECPASVRAHFPFTLPVRHHYPDTEAPLMAEHVVDEVAEPGTCADTVHGRLRCEAVNLEAASSVGAVSARDYEYRLRH
jgi:hypothetical protein